jgi:hypothetical protein
MHLVKAVLNKVGCCLGHSLRGCWSRAPFRIRLAPPCTLFVSPRSPFHFCPPSTSAISSIDINVDRVALYLLGWSLAALALVCVQLARGVRHLNRQFDDEGELIILLPSYTPRALHLRSFFRLSMQVRLGLCLGGWNYSRSARANGSGTIRK